jgi:hypothetical protein
MRLASVASILLATVTLASAQSPIRIGLSQEGTANGASIEAAATAPYQGAPWAAIPVTRPDAGQQTDFRIRAWQETGRVRVVVFAVVKAQQAGPQRETVELETQIATFLLSPGESTTLSAEQYGARPVTITASAQ